MKRFLLDTHIFLWAIAGNSRLKAAARRMIEDAEEIQVSACSIWEIAIKARLGKIDADAAEVAAAIEGSGFRELSVRAAHCAGVAHLPLHHADPFDRLLIAQALAESLTLLTADPVLAQYGKSVAVI
jgi:PIN domain nuclease of toxin-antitoxin system